MEFIRVQLLDHYFLCLSYSTQLRYIQSRNLDHHLYAGVAQICLSLTTPDTNYSLNQLGGCFQNVFHWMTNSKLKLMQIKQSFLVLVHKSSVLHFCYYYFSTTPIISQRPSLYGIYESSLIIINSLDSIFHTLVVATFATALVSGVSDYGNSIYYDIAIRDILTFQSVQNCLAMVATRSPRFSH